MRSSSHRLALNQEAAWGTLPQSTRGGLFTAAANARTASNITRKSAPLRRAFRIASSPRPLWDLSGYASQSCWIRACSVAFGGGFLGFPDFFPELFPAPALPPWGGLRGVLVLGLGLGKKDVLPDASPDVLGDLLPGGQPDRSPDVPGDVSPDASPGMPLGMSGLHIQTGSWPCFGSSEVEESSIASRALGIVTKYFPGRCPLGSPSYWSHPASIAAARTLSSVRQVAMPRSGHNWPLKYVTGPL